MLGLSIIICGTFPQIPNELDENIKLTIGNVKYEIIYINNSLLKHSIFNVYNIGLEKSKYDYICFMHQDILFLSNNWGEISIKRFQHSQIGLLGVIGAKYISENALGWWEAKDKCGFAIDNSHGVMAFSSQYESVSCVDGLWMIVRKDLYPQIKFDEDTFSGFHCYDMDLCLQILYSGFEVAIEPSIKIFHNSGGNCSTLFYINTLKLRNKYYNKLPISCKQYYFNIREHNAFNRNKSKLLLEKLLTGKISDSGLSDISFLCSPFKQLLKLALFLDHLFRNEQAICSIFLYKICFVLLRIHRKIFQIFHRLFFSKKSS